MRYRGGVRSRCRNERLGAPHGGGTPPEPRARTLGYIELLRPSYQASLKEVMHFIEREALYGRGCGLVDTVLLASTLMTPGAELWTLDKRLSTLADGFGVAYRPPSTGS